MSKHRTIKKCLLRSLLILGIYGGGETFFVNKSYGLVNSILQKTDSLEKAKILAQAESTQLISINKIQVIGSSVFTEADFAPIIQPLEGKSVTEQQLREVVQAITQLYLNQGYLNSRATYTGTQEGIATIQVIEGSIGEIIIQGTDSLQNYICSRVGLGVGKPLNTRNLEEQLRLLRNDPLFTNVEATLKPPQTQINQQSTPIETTEFKCPQNPSSQVEQSQSSLVVRVTEAESLIGSVGVDNYSPPSIGATRFNLDLGYRNFTGIGDEISAAYRPRFEAWDETYRLELNYRAPLNPHNGTLRVNTLIERNKVVDGPESITEFNIQGNSERYTVDYRQPLIRNPREELALSVGFSYYTSRQTFLDDNQPLPLSFAPDGVINTSVITLGQDYVFREATGAWGVRSQFRIGTGLFDATTNDSPNPSGQFFSWLGQLQRVQVINPSNFLIIQLDAQLTPNSLLPSEQFVIGGGQSVRGYRQNILGGDNGFRFSIEDRIILVRNQFEDPVFTIAPFFDMGAVWNAPDNPNVILADQTFIAALGLGLIFQPIKKLNIRLDYAPPIYDLNTRGNNIQDDGFYFSVNYGF